MVNRGAVLGDLGNSGTVLRDVINSGAVLGEVVLIVRQYWGDCTDPNLYS